MKESVEEIAEGTGELRRCNRECGFWRKDGKTDVCSYDGKIRANEVFGTHILCMRGVGHNAECGYGLRKDQTDGEAISQLIRKKYGRNKDKKE